MHRTWCRFNVGGIFVRIIFDSFATWAQEGQTGQPGVSKRVPRGAIEVLIGSSRLQNECSKKVKMPSGCPRRVAKEVVGRPSWVKNIKKHEMQQSTTNLLACLVDFREMLKEM